VRQGTTQEIAEAAQLKTAVANISAMLASGTACQGSASSILLATMLESAKSRLAHIERNIEEEEKEQRQKSASELAIAYKARQETKLNAVEQRQYAEFLEKPHFTKSDFGILESFYTKTWDRLSEDGKAEMSQRLWGGVRSKEYEFSEMPDVVKEKEAQRLYNALRSQAPIHQSLQSIKPEDRSDFLKAWDDNRRSEAFEILDRPSFAQNVSLNAGAVKAESVKASTQSEASKILTPHVAASENEEISKTINTAGVAALKLDDLLLVDSVDSKSTAPLPELKNTGSKAKAP
jgi:hypothetical protein